MIQVFVVLITLLLISLIVMTLRNGVLREKYAALWIVVAFAVLVLAIWPPLLTIVAGWFGVQVESNLLFALAVILLLGVSLQLSVAVSELDSQTRTLAEEVALLHGRIDEIENEDCAG